MSHPARRLLPQPSEIHAASTWCTQDFVTVVELLESVRLRTHRGTRVATKRLNAAAQPRLNDRISPKDQRS
jgi:hypothetical protein